MEKSKISRREFLKATGTAAAALALWGCTSQETPAPTESVSSLSLRELFDQAFPADGMVDAGYAPFINKVLDEYLPLPNPDYSPDETTKSDLIKKFMNWDTTPTIHPLNPGGETKAIREYFQNDVLEAMAGSEFPPFKEMGEKLRGLIAAGKLDVVAEPIPQGWAGSAAARYSYTLDESGELYHKITINSDNYSFKTGINRPNLLAVADTMLHEGCHLVRAQDCIDFWHEYAPDGLKPTEGYFMAMGSIDSERYSHWITSDATYQMAEIYKEEGKDENLLGRYIHPLELSLAEKQHELVKNGEKWNGKNWSKEVNTYLETLAK